MKIPQIEYEFYYPLNSSKLVKLDLSKCKGIKIVLNIPIKIEKTILIKIIQVVAIIITYVINQRQNMVLIYLYQIGKKNTVRKNMILFDIILMHKNLYAPVILKIIYAL